MGPEYYQNAPEEIKAHQKVPNEQNNTKRDQNLAKRAIFFGFKLLFKIPF